MVSDSTYTGAAVTLRSDLLVHGPQNPNATARFSLNGKSSVLGIGNDATLFVPKLVRAARKGREGRLAPHVAQALEGLGRKNGAGAKSVLGGGEGRALRPGVPRQARHLTARQR